MVLLDKTLEEFIELFQGSNTYFGVSKPTGKKTLRERQNSNIGLEKTND